MEGGLETKGARVEDRERGMKRVVEGAFSQANVHELELQRSRQGSSIQAACEFEPYGDGYLLDGERLDLIEGEESLDLRLGGLGLKEGEEGGGGGRRERWKQETTVHFSESFESRGRDSRDSPFLRREEEGASRPGDGYLGREEGRRARGRRGRLERSLRALKHRRSEGCGALFRGGGGREEELVHPWPYPRRKRVGGWNRCWLLGRDEGEEGELTLSTPLPSSSHLLSLRCPQTPSSLFSISPSYSFLDPPFSSTLSAFCPSSAKFRTRRRFSPRPTPSQHQL